MDDASEGRGPLPAADLARRIQNTLVGPAITAEQIRDHVASAIECGFHAITVPGCWVGYARELLGMAGRSAGQAAGGAANPTASQHSIGVGAILDFPYGSALTTTRAAGAAALVAAGADQIDSTVNIGLALSGRMAEFSADLAAVVQAAAPVPVKFMLELPLLTAAQRTAVVEAAVAAGAAYVKNASRGAVGIADPATISYLRSVVPPHVGVKASGGVRTLVQVRELLAAGADLVGTSSGVAIVTGRRERGGSLDNY